MKAILLIVFIPIFVCLSFFAKAQQSGLWGINYQAIARENPKGAVIALQTVRIKFSILDGGPDANPVYTELHNDVLTNTQGLFSVVIGGGTPEIGDFKNIPWSKGNQYLRVDMSMGGQSAFVPMGVMPFMAVPYALYAANGGSGGGGNGGTNVSIVWLGTLATPPATPSAGQAYYNSTDKRSYIYDTTGGTANWNIMAQDGLPGTSLNWLGSFTSAPSSPGLNQAYYDLTDRKAYVYDGSAWQVFSESGQNGVGTGVSWLGSLATPPASPLLNQAYYNTVDKKSYIYDTTGAGSWQILTQDGLSGISGTSISWLGSLATPPASPTINQAYYNTADKKSYIYDTTGAGSWNILAQDGSTGISISWLGTLAAPPASAITNQAYYNSADRKAYIYDTTGTWQILAQDGTGWNLSNLEFQDNGSIGLTTTANTDTMKSANRAWLVRGNKDTNPALDFIGTVDDNPFIIKAGGTAPNFERFRTFPDKPVTILNGTDDAGAQVGKAVLTVFSSEVPTGIINNDPNYSNGIVGYANSSTGAGVAGYNFGSGPGVKGYTAFGPAVLGLGTSRYIQGVKGTNSSTNGGLGVEGTTNSPYKPTTEVRSAGVMGSSQHASGYGVVGIGNNLKPDLFTNPPTIGGGMMGIGTRAGVVGFGTTATNGLGVVGGGNNEVVVYPIGGAGVAGSAGGLNTGVGVHGFAKGSATDIDRWGGVFQFGTGISSVHVYTYLAGANSTGIYGLISNGTKSTVVKDNAGENRLLFCTEAPEVLFQDFGTGELQNGAAHIDLEGLLTKVIRVDAKHPMKVFIQLEGECNGVYVTNKSAKGFDVKELQGGKSNVPFTWQIVASRADEVLPDGTVLPYSDRRFPVGPGPLPVQEASTAATPDAPAASAKPALKTVELKTTEKEVINKAFSNLQFASAKADIAATSLPSLDKMASLLQAHPEWQLSLSGHTDNEGTEAFNQTLSEKRSEAVKQYLVSKGVTAGRITTKGYGQTKPLAANDSKAAKGMNRRVEMEILTEEKP